MGESAELRVNGVVCSVRARPDRSLLTVLRYELGLTGTKYGCGEGECGACTVLVEGAPTLACQWKLSEALGHPITTIEGLASPGGLSPVQEAFVALRAFQCGYCTPGMIVRATALLREHPDPSPDEVATALEPNVCRCGGYARILAAVARAAARAREVPPP